MNNILSSNGAYAPGLLIQIVVMKVIATSICRGSGLQASTHGRPQGWRRALADGPWAGSPLAARPCRRGHGWAHPLLCTTSHVSLPPKK